MKPALRARFWVEVAGAWLAASLAVPMLLWRARIEAVVRVDPDRSNGSMEWTIVTALLTVLVLLALALAVRAEGRGALP
ncbi:MAG: hypothetical protein JO304_13760 [Solirubrobacterales bacterium]|nr:hypothetical protein [Solirubrobacterales bacterium]